MYMLWPLSPVHIFVQMTDSPSCHVYTVANILTHARAITLACRDLVQCANTIHSCEVSQNSDDFSPSNQQWSHSVLHTVGGITIT